MTSNYSGSNCQRQLECCVLTLLACVTLSGCATPPVYYMRYESYPPGALVSWEGRQLGRCPVLAKHPISQTELQKGVLVVSNVVARWDDGRTKEKTLVCTFPNDWQQRHGARAMGGGVFILHADEPTNCFPVVSQMRVQALGGQTNEMPTTAQRLRTLRDLRESGVLTEEEYNRERRAIVDGL